MMWLARRKLTPRQDGGGRGDGRGDGDGDGRDGRGRGDGRGFGGGRGGGRGDGDDDDDRDGDGRGRRQGNDNDNDNDNDNNDSPEVEEDVEEDDDQPVESPPPPTPSPEVTSPVVEASPPATVEQPPPDAAPPALPDSAPAIVATPVPILSPVVAPEVPTPLTAAIPALQSPPPDAAPNQNAVLTTLTPLADAPVPSIAFSTIVPAPSQIPTEASPISILTVAPPGLSEGVLRPQTSTDAAAAPGPTGNTPLTASPVPADANLRGANPNGGADGAVGSMSSGQKGGIAVGSIAGIALLLFLVMFVYKRRRGSLPERLQSPIDRLTARWRRSSSSKASPPPGPHDDDMEKWLTAPADSPTWSWDYRDAKPTIPGKLRSLTRFLPSNRLPSNPTPEQEAGTGPKVWARSLFRRPTKGPTPTGTSRRYTVSPGDPDAEPLPQVPPVFMEYPGSRLSEFTPPASPAVGQRAPSSASSEVVAPPDVHPLRAHGVVPDCLVPGGPERRLTMSAGQVTSRPVSSSQGRAWPL